MAWLRVLQPGSHMPKNRKDRGFFRFQILMTIMILAIALFTYVVRIPVDRRLSETHQKNRNASYSYDSYDSYDMELGSSGTDWDASFCLFSYIIRIGDRKNPRYLRSLWHMRTRLSKGIIGDDSKDKWMKEKEHKSASNS